MKRGILLLLFCISMAEFFAQHARYIAFDLIYYDKNLSLTPSQKEKLDHYLAYATSCNINMISVDPSLSKSEGMILFGRINSLRQYLFAQGIDTNLLVILKNPKQHSDAVHHLSDEFDVLRVALNYSSEKPLAKVVLPESNESVERVILLEQGVQSTSEVSLKKCSELVEIPWLDQHKLLLNNCDYEYFAPQLALNNYSPEEIQHFKNLPVLSKSSHILAAYDFSLKQGLSLTYPARLSIPIEPCMERQELSLYFCQDSSCQLISMENAYSPEDEYVSFKLQKSGLYFLIYLNQRVEHEIKMKLPKGLYIQQMSVNSRCHGIDYPLTYKKRKARVILTESYYEPVVQLTAVDRNGRKYQVTNLPISAIEGKKKIKDFKVRNFYVNGPQERLFPVFERYKLSFSSLKKR